MSWCDPWSCWNSLSTRWCKHYKCLPEWWTVILPNYSLAFVVFISVEMWSGVLIIYETLDTFFSFIPVIHSGLFCNNESWLLIGALIYSSLFAWHDDPLVSLLQLGQAPLRPEPYFKNILSQRKHWIGTYMEIAEQLHSFIYKSAVLFFSCWPTVLCVFPVLV